MLILSGALAVGTIPGVSRGADPAGPAVEFFGCTALKGTAQQYSCMLVPEDQLTLWVGNRTCKDVLVSDSGQPLQAETFAVQGGCQLRLPRSPGRHRSALTLTDRTNQQPFWSMSLDRSKPTLLEWKRHVWDRATASPEEIVPELQRMATEKLDSEGLIDVTYALGQAYYRIGDRNEALRAFRYVKHLASKAGYRSIALSAGYDQAFLLRQAGLHAEARKCQSEMLAAVTAGDAYGLIRLESEQGLLDRAEERLDSALQSFERAYSASIRVSDKVAQASVFPVLAEALVLLDRTEAARQLLLNVDDLLVGQTTCRKSARLANAATVGLQILESSVSAEVTPYILIGRRTIREALIYALDLEQQCAQSANREAIYLAMVRLARIDGRYIDAHMWIEKLQGLPSLSVQARIELLEESGLLSMAEGKTTDAQQFFVSMDAVSQKHPDSFASAFLCRASVGLAEAQRAIGQSDTRTTDVVRRCLSSPTTGLPKSLLRRIKSRAQAIGVIAP